MEVQERIASTVTEREFFGETKADVFEALADWYSVNEEEEFVGLVHLHAGKKNHQPGYELRVKTKRYGD